MINLRKASEKISKLISLFKDQTPKELEAIFTDIYNGNKFNGDESISGQGSSIAQTKVIINELPILFKDLNIVTLLDIPCGDFNWMQNVPLNNIDYLGADIVDDLIKKNISKYKTENIRFCKLDLLKDDLPKVDLIFCRDCLVHLSFSDIFIALSNICRSQSTYLLTTTFTNRDKNVDIKTGGWRTLNLEIKPFSFPLPIQVINEMCTEGEMNYTDKSLGLWKIEDIKNMLEGINF
jgi:hypothetical protein